MPWGAVVTGNPIADVVLGVIGLLGIVLTRRLKQVGDSVDEVKKASASMHEDLSTNHGKKPFEYLEMIAEVREAVLDQRVSTASMRNDLMDLRMELEQHTASDAVNFNELREAIRQVDGKVVQLRQEVEDSK